jgi:hypothetical protein
MNNIERTSFIAKASIDSDIMSFPLKAAIGFDKLVDLNNSKFDSKAGVLTLCDFNGEGIISIYYETKHSIISRLLQGIINKKNEQQENS